MRKPLIAGNWKMHGTQTQVAMLVEGLKQNAGLFRNIDIVVLPVFVHLIQVRDLLSLSTLLYGAQNLYLGAQGAFTGEVSGPMLADIGCRYVLVGHSERRSIFNENLELVAAKFKAALDAGLIPILCVGETREQRERGEMEDVIKEQIESVIRHVDIEGFKQAVIAYEPVWAIGTGLTASPEQAQAVHGYIRQLISQNNVDIGSTIRILYGGSLKADNAESILAMPDIDGGLVGGASLKANDFSAICAAADVQFRKVS